MCVRGPGARRHRDALRRVGVVGVWGARVIEGPDKLQRGSRKATPGDNEGLTGEHGPFTMDADGTVYADPLNFDAIAEAHEEIVIANAYFLPGRKLRRALPRGVLACCTLGIWRRHARTLSMVPAVVVFRETWTTGWSDRAPPRPYDVTVLCRVTSETECNRM